MVLSMTAELVVQDYLKKLWPPSVSADLLKQIDENAFSDSDISLEDPITESNLSDEEIDSNTEEPSNSDSNTPASNLGASLINAPEAPLSENLTTDEESLISEQVLDLLPTIDYGTIKFQPANYSGKLFELLDTTPFNPDEVALGQLIRTDQGQNEAVGAIYELALPNQTEARKLYVQIKSQARDVAEIEVNETNQFGDNSFYLNHKAKVGQVFLVILGDNKIYALAYQKDLHEVMKPFLGLLL